MLQLNFISGYDEQVLEEGVPQLEFWDPSYKQIRHPRNYSTLNIEKHFHELDKNIVNEYTTYWESLIPKNDSEIFQRWLFAFMSVHTSWKMNMLGYNAIKNWWLWLNKWDDLHKLIENSRVGIHNLRTKYISEFSHKFWESPESYKKTATESWENYRDRLKTLTLGLGPAKTSFAIEMCYPTSAKLVCLDTHMFKAYGLDQVKDVRQYNKIERHWVDMCIMWRVPSYIARCIYWDSRQGYTDSRYWSSVFEKQ